MILSVALDDPHVPVHADDAVAALHRAHYRDLVRLAGLLLHDRGASEEVVQDAFVQLHLRWRRLRDEDKAAAWLRSAVLNGARSRIRHLDVRRRHRPAPGPDHESAEDAALARGSGVDRSSPFAASRCASAKRWCCATTSTSPKRTWPRRWGSRPVR